MSIEVSCLCKYIILSILFFQVSEWYSTVGDDYLSKTDLGDSLGTAQILQEQHLRFELEARVRKLILLHVTFTSMG